MSESTNNHTVNSQETDLYWIKKFWKNILFYAKNSSQPSGINLTSTIQKEIDAFSNTLIIFGPIRSNTLRMSAQKYFRNNPMALTAAYKQLLEIEKAKPNYYEEFNPIAYSYNPNSFKIQFLAEVLNETRIMNPQLYLDHTEELNILKANILKLDNVFEKRLKQHYIQLLVTIGNFMKRFNLLEEYSNTYENMLSDCRLHGLSYPCHTDLPNCKSIDTCFTENYLNSLTLPKLAALSGFWLNKTAKWIISLNIMLFIINEYDLWKDIKQNKKYCPLDDEKIITLLKKTTFLSKLENNIFDSMEAAHLQRPTMTPEEISDLFVNTLDQRIAAEKTRYKNRFDIILPSFDNDLETDIMALHRIANTRYLLYRLKDMCIFNLIMGSIDNHYSKNWGVIPETIANDGFVNINFDIEGLNLPLRLHMYQSELIDFLNDYTGDSIIPLYKGANDLNVRGRYISSNIMMPMFVKQTSFINTALQNPKDLPPDIIDFLRHLKFLKDSSKVPPALKNVNPKEPNAMNLETGEKVNIPAKEMFKR